VVRTRTRDPVLAMNALVGPGHAAQHLLAVDEPETPFIEDITGAEQEIRDAITRLATGMFLVAMTAITSIAIAATSQPTIVVVAGIAGAGAVAAIVAIGLLKTATRRADRLGLAVADLREGFNRVRLDAIRDPLTGLGNHRAFQEELERAAASEQRHHQSTTLLLIDVDDLKRVNDAEGHAAGDEVLRAVSRVIARNSRRTDRAFRIGGDEFAILSSSSSVNDGLALGRRVLATSLDRERNPGQRAISLTIGISALPSPSADRHLLFRHADAALYWGKRHGRTDVQVYDPKLHGVADDERPSEELASAVDKIVDRRLLTPVYQPVFALSDGACVGFEGLIRPQEGAGFRNAGALFVAAEAVNRTVELDLAAVRALAGAARELAPAHYLAVNLSPRTLEAAAFNPHEVLSLLAQAGIEPRRLVVELTEREAVEDYDLLARNLAVFRRVGARIAADDVGAGNAGLQLLSRIDFDIIKIDLSLVQSGAVLAPSRAVLRALIEMADRRGAATVAEGIETPIQLETVRDLGIQVGQGYLLGVPSAHPWAASIDVKALLSAAEPERGARAVSAPAAI
jgi:diguanylate cyclase (GGDEF)-like protein